MRPLISLQQEADQGEMAGPNRWMVSYADFITLLFVLFLVLFTRLPKPGEVERPQAQPLPARMIPEIRPRQTLVPPRIPAGIPAQMQTPEQQVLLQKLAHALDELIQAEDISLMVRPEGVLLEIRDTALFASGTAQPAERAAAILAGISDVLGEGRNSVIVEGHTDSLPIHSAQYPSNWELSSARAASIVRVLQEHGIASKRLTAAGLADTHPKGPNDTAQGRSENRRVSLLVLNDPKSDDHSSVPQ